MLHARGWYFPLWGKIGGAFFMGWVLKGSRQKLVVCRYEEEPARGVSLDQQREYHVYWQREGTALPSLDQQREYHVYWQRVGITPLEQYRERVMSWALTKVEYVQYGFLYLILTMAQINSVSRSCKFFFLRGEGLLTGVRGICLLNGIICLPSRRTLWTIRVYLRDMYPTDGAHLSYISLFGHGAWIHANGAWRPVHAGLIPPPSTSPKRLAKVSWNSLQQLFPLEAGDWGETRGWRTNKRKTRI